MSKVFIAGQIPDAASELLQKAGLEIDTFSVEGLIDQATLKKGVAEADFLITPLSTKVDAEIIDAAPKLKLIANFGAGFNNIDVEYAKKKGIPVTNTPFVSATSTAEVTTGLIISLSHLIVEGDQLMRGAGFNGWAPLFFLGHELSGKTLGIIGMGQIGQQVAKRMHAFDMPILYTQRHQLPKAREVELGARFVTKDELVKNSDIITLHIPDTPSTHHYLGAAEFKAMKKSALLINAARGAVIDELGLLKALQDKELAGAALDVYEKEPKVDDGFKQLKNVILTPHIGNATVEARNAMATIVATNCIAADQGEEIKYIVNK
ncbi:2-hydroxyacid dehydrogenase family protein [Companilactobacillus zhongbaensis]|uniref:2-hydroxyacid dehydrogenase family protein n=1 Tax=Companilactobacillus zhongbaensis TaxID=2486009 RepID=UPI000F767489|nr:2-hydroxyacid dehydrogenase family protein [Companilactobacillus zhongbaensis]